MGISRTERSRCLVAVLQLADSWVLQAPSGTGLCAGHSGSLHVADVGGGLSVPSFRCATNFWICFSRSAKQILTDKVRL